MLGPWKRRRSVFLAYLQITRSGDPKAKQPRSGRFRVANVRIQIDSSVFLVLRTFLSIYVASVNGRIVKAIIELDLSMFIKRVLITFNNRSSTLEWLLSQPHSSTATLSFWTRDCQFISDHDSLTTSMTNTWRTWSTIRYSYLICSALKPW
jgi:hypothetical protein